MHDSAVSAKVVILLALAKLGQLAPSCGFGWQCRDTCECPRILVDLLMRPVTNEAGLED